MDCGKTIKSLSCVRLSCDPMDYSPPDSLDKNTGVSCQALLQGILLTSLAFAGRVSTTSATWEAPERRVTESLACTPEPDTTWSTSCVCSSLSHATPRTGAHQAPLSVGFSRQEYWNGLPFLSPKTTVLWYKVFKKHKDYLRSQKSVSDTQSLWVCLAVELPHIPREAHKIV